MQDSRITDLLVVLGGAIRSRRSELGYSQEGFASKIGLHRTYVGSVERGERNLSLVNLVRIAGGLGVSASWLLHRAERMLAENE
jgi:transcriptional regulator with XRE-family HTH domain